MPEITVGTHVTWTHVSQSRRTLTMRRSSEENGASSVNGDEEDEAEDEQLALFELNKHINPKENL